MQTDYIKEQINEPVLLLVIEQQQNQQPNDHDR